MPRGKMTDEQKRKISEANKKRHAEKKAAKEAKEKIEAEVAAAVQEKTEQPDLSIDAEMNRMNEDGEDAIKQKVIQDAIAQALAEMSGEKKQVRVDVNKCSRHPHQDVKPGENCPLCIAATKRHAESMKLKQYVLPCPKCGSETKEERGGPIKTYYSKQGHFSCGQCELDYNVKGEVVTWESGKAGNVFNNELVYRKNRS